MKKLYIIVAFVLAAALLAACGSQSGSGTPDSAATTDSAGIKYNIISTPYAELRVNEELGQKVSHKESGTDPYVVTFSSKKDDTELFSLVFKGKGDTLFGTLVGEDENIVIYTNTSKLDEKSDNYKENLTLQAELRDILDCLTADYEIILGEEVSHEVTSNFEIETSVVTLKYPNKWKDRVNVEVTDDSVKFSDGETPVFDLVFKECDGYLLGTYKDTPIYMVEHPVEKDDQAAMQQDVNVILKYLMQDPNFVM